MASDGERCGGLGSFLAMSCRGRAEAFARRLHTKLRSLGSQDENGSVDESSWLAANENPITISQPAHSNSNNDKFVDIAVLESPGSPEEELDEIDLSKLMNKDTLQPAHTNNGIESNQNQQFTSNSTDIDNDLPFYDTQESRLNHTNGVESIDDDNSDTYFNSVDLSSQSEDVSLMLSLRDEDLPSFGAKCNGDSTKSHNNVSDKIIVSDEKLVSVDSYECKDANNTNHEDDLDLLDEDKPPRVRRSTSLKTGKTPPGTPGQKKIVRFADALGLDLADVRTFLDDIPKVPNSAYEDLLNADISESSTESSLSCAQLKPTTYLMPLFQQPGGLANFLDIVREFNVCLENVFVDDPFLLSLKGTVRVRNLDFHKSVHIRYTLDSWKTFADVQATYVNNSCDGFSDKFSFLLYAHTLSIGQRLELACRFQCKGFQYWDNNKGVNYCFQCLPSSQTTSHTTSATVTPHDDWGASFY